MVLLPLGLLLFLSAHSVRIYADGWRTRQRARLGEGTWKGLFPAVSLAGLGGVCPLPARLADRGVSFRLMRDGHQPLPRPWLRAWAARQRAMPKRP